MGIRGSIRILVLIWGVWSLVLLGFQTIVSTRFQPYRPDRALDWTPKETARNSQDDKPYLLEPFMNHQVSWDSEFYLSIATEGYDDPSVRLVTTREGEKLSMNYAFLPLYPLTMRVIRIPFTWLGLTPVGASALAGVLVALMGTLGGMVALFDLMRCELGEAGGRRAAFYLLIFPSSFFLAQVYTEGLFIGLSLGCLAVLRRHQFGLAALLAVLATWTRGIGIALFLPLLIAWLEQGGWQMVASRRWSGKIARQGLLTLSPIAAYLIWMAVLGRQFTAVEDAWFGRSTLDFGRMAAGWGYAIERFLSGEIGPMRVYYGIEFAAVLLALTACIVTLRRHPGAALFGLAALLIPLTSGAPQSLVRYVLSVPPVFMALGRWGQNEVFDRTWTVGSLLLMGMLTTLFTFDMWVA